MRRTIKQRLHPTLELTKLIAAEAFHDNIFKMSAALAYYTVFSLVPMLIIIIWISALFYEPAKVQSELFIKLNELIGSDAGKQVQAVLLNTKFDQHSGWAKVLGILTLILTATGIFAEIQDSINTIWGLKAIPKKGFIKLLFNRLTSFSLLIALGFALAVALLINAVISIVTAGIKSHFPHVPVALFYVGDQLILFVLLSFLFASIYKILPDAKIKWRDVSGGAMISTLLFMSGKYLIGYYLVQNATISAYGSASAVIILLLWVYYSSIILYLGATFTECRLKVREEHVQPNKYAIWVEEKVEKVSSNTEIEKEDIPQ